MNNKTEECCLQPNSGTGTEDLLIDWLDFLGEKIFPNYQYTNSELLTKLLSIITAYYCVMLSCKFVKLYKSQFIV